MTASTDSFMKLANDGGSGNDSGPQTETDGEQVEPMPWDEMPTFSVKDLEKNLSALMADMFQMIDLTMNNKSQHQQAKRLVIERFEAMYRKLRNGAMPAGYGEDGKARLTAPRQW